MHSQVQEFCDSPTQFQDLCENYNQEIVLTLEDDTPTQRYLIPNQHLLTEMQFVVVDPKTKMYQKVILTNYRLILKRKILQSIPYAYIQEIKSLERFIRVYLKTGLMFDLYVDTNQYKLEQQLSKALKFIPFCLNCSSETQLPYIYDSQAEIQRMRVDCRLYCIFKNQGRKFVPTYPLHFLVPKGVDPSSFAEVRKCRLLGRIPVLTYYNEKTGVGLWRAAKCKQDLGEDVIRFDRHYLRSIPGSLIRLQIEQTCVTKSNISFQCLQTLRLTFFSLNKCYQYSLQSTTGSKIDMYKSLTKWYQQIDKLLSMAYNAVQFISQNQQVLIQQNYALDRSSQVLVLAQIVMDPFFRTFDGLSILMEKEFVCFGHPFQDRCGFKVKKEQEISPIFIQLLECIHQLVVTHPSCFEYTSCYLSRIGYETYTTKYKNFLNKNGDVEMEKLYNKCSMGLWDGLKPWRKCSPHYNKNTKKELWEIRKKPSIKEYMFWVHYYDLICKMEAEND